jgi:tryptophan halogenase
LASCFVEPLQATSIHTTIAQLVLFVMEFLKPDKNSVLLPESINAYNRRTSKLYDLNLDFVSMHYQGGRTDTPFWKYVKENKIVSPYAQDVITRTKNKIVSFHDIGNNYGAPAIGLWNWTMAGLGIITPEQAKADLDYNGIYDHAERQYLKFLSQADVVYR